MSINDVTHCRRFLTPYPKLGLIAYLRIVTKSFTHSPKSFIDDPLFKVKCKNNYINCHFKRFCWNGRCTWNHRRIKFLGFWRQSYWQLYYQHKYVLNSLMLHYFNLDQWNSLFLVEVSHHFQKKFEIKLQFSMQNFTYRIAY